MRDDLKACFTLATYYTVAASDMGEVLVPFSDIGLELVERYDFLCWDSWGSPDFLNPCGFVHRGYLPL